MSLLSVIAVANLALGVYSFCINRAVDETDYYILYVGTNDKDTYKPEISLEEAFGKVEAICVKYLKGATFDTAKETWKDETGTLPHENTIQIFICHADIDTIHKLSDEILKELNQNSIMILKGHASIQYYYGK